MTSTSLARPRAPCTRMPEIHARRWFLLGIMCLSLVVVVMSVSGLVTAIPTMQQELGASASQIQWVLDAYAVVFAGSLLTAGALGDRFGRKRALLVGLVVFGAGALVAGVASSASQVIAGRAVMGIGAGPRDARDVVDHHDDLPARGANARDRGMGGIRRCGRRTRADRVGRVARGVLVGFGRAREPPDRGGDVRRDLDLRARVARRVRDTARPRRRRALPRRA